MLDLTPDEASAAMCTAYRVAHALKAAFDPPGLTLLQANGKEGTVTRIMVLATGVIAGLFVTVVIHDRDLLQAGVYQFKVGADERLEIFALAQAQIGMVWGWGLGCHSGSLFWGARHEVASGVSRCLGVFGRG